jgi:hypothetical protein
MTLASLDRFEILFISDMTLASLARFEILFISNMTLTSLARFEILFISNMTLTEPSDGSNQTLFETNLRSPAYIPLGSGDI